MLCWHLNANLVAPCSSPHTSPLRSGLKGVPVCQDTKLVSHKHFWVEPCFGILSLSLYTYIYIYIYHNFENPPPHAYRRCADHARAHEAPDTFFQCCSEPSEVQSLSTQIGHRRERNIIPAKIRRLKLLGKSRWTWEVHPLESRFCLSQSLWDPESQYGDWPQKRAREVGAEAPPCNIYDSNHTML